MNAQEKCKAVRRFIRDNPGCQGFQIKKALGIPVRFLPLGRLLKAKVIRFTQRSDESGEVHQRYYETPSTEE